MENQRDEYTNIEYQFNEYIFSVKQKRIVLSPITCDMRLFYMCKPGFIHIDNVLLYLCKHVHIHRYRIIYVHTYTLHHASMAIHIVHSYSACVCMGIYTSIILLIYAYHYCTCENTPMHIDMTLPTSAIIVTHMNT